MSDVTTESEAETGAPEPEESGKMSFLEHLDELRKRLVHVAAYLGIGFVVALFFSQKIYDFLAAPLIRSLPAKQNQLVYTGITQPFLVYMKVAFLAGIFLTIPLTLYEVWKFIAPGLYRKEKKYIVPFLVFSVVLFILGGLFCYYLVLPAGFKVLIELGASWMPMITIAEYLDTVNMMLLGFGMIFEMPVIAAFLALFGLISAKFLWKKFSYALVGIVTLAAILSPTGDAFNLILWSAPMVVLYLISIVVTAIIGWRKSKATA